MGEPIHAMTLEAAADLSALQYHLMRISAINKTNLATVATTSTLLGTLLNKPKSGEFASIGFFGESKVVAGGVITAGDLITTTTSGRAAVVASAQIAVGRALETSANDGEIIKVLFFPAVRWTGAA